MKALNNFSLKKLFFNNNFVIVFSIIVAIISWMVITVNQAPMTEFVIKDVPVTIPIEGSAASERGLDVINFDNSIPTVTVTVKGPKYIVSSLTASDVAVTASLSNVTAPGKYNLDLKASKISQGEFEVLGTNPGTILATFDYIDTKKFTLIAEAEGASAVTGLIAENAVVSDSNYSVITVKGPRTELELLDKIVAKATVNAVISETTSYTANIFLLDESGAELDKAPFKITAVDNTDVTTVEISVPVSKTKEVPIKVTFTNVPASFDTSKLNYQTDYSKILIIGPPETIDSITELQLEPIDLFNLTPEGSDVRVRPILPSGVKIYDQVSDITVEFPSLGSYQVKTFTVTQFKGSTDVQGTLTAEIKNVKICAPRNIMWRISSSDLTAVADLTGKTAGDHSVDVVITCSEAGTIWQVGTYKATVTVK